MQEPPQPDNPAPEQGPTPSAAPAPEPGAPGYTTVLRAMPPARMPDPGSPWRAKLAAVLAVLLVVAVAVVQRLDEGKPKVPSGQAQGGALLEGSDEVAILGRVFVKIGHAFKGASGVERGALGPWVAQMDAAAKGPVDRLRVAVACAELVGPEAALSRVEKLREELRAARVAPDGAAGAEQPEPSQKTPAPDLSGDLDALEVIYTRGVDQLSPEQREALAARHGWFGRLALSHGLPDTDPARAPLLEGGGAIIAIVVAFLVVVLAAGVAGLVLFILAMAMLGAGRLKKRFVPPLPGGSVFLETFAIFLAALLVLGLAGDLLGRQFPQHSGAVGATLLAAHWLLFLVLLYPLTRGLDWAGLRRRIGWTGGRGVMREIGAGIVGYLAGIPIFLLGVLVALVMLVLQMAIQSASGGQSQPLPKNPILERLAGGGPVMLVVFFVMATVWAPLVEEGIFRGCLFRHLRARWHPILAGMASAIAFGVIHPVPLVLTPPLMALGFNFAMIREWRGSLVGAMTAHCLHNATILALVIGVLSQVGD